MPACGEFDRGRNASCGHRERPAPAYRVSTIDECWRNQTSSTSAQILLEQQWQAFSWQSCGTVRSRRSCGSDGELLVVSVQARNEKFRGTCGASFRSSMVPAGTVSTGTEVRDQQVLACADPSNESADAWSGIDACSNCASRTSNQRHVTGKCPRFIQAVAGIK
jgi:hypothetical protein